MAIAEQYESGKASILSDPTICKPNRELFRKFFEFEEYKLKRQNGLARLDDACYRTLYTYVIRFRNVNAWFNNKSWQLLTKADIKRVYDDLEEGRIKNQRGTPFKDRASYYNKIFKSKPFRLAQKSELACEVIEYYHEDPNKEPRFVTEETFRSMIAVISNPVHLLLFWLAWDLGENISTLLALQKKDFVRQINAQTKEPEYLVNLPKSKIKRTRKSRTEPTLYAETVRYADIVLASIAPEDGVFNFGHRQALKIIHAVALRSNAVCMPNNAPVRWKDLRSGMACHLLKKGWRREEVDARLGHTPNSSALNAYINFLAIDREQSKKRLFDSSLEVMQNKLEERLQREKLLADRIRRQQEDNQLLKVGLDETRTDLRALTAVVSALKKRVLR